VAGERPKQVVKVAERKLNGADLLRKVAPSEPAPAGRQHRLHRVPMQQHYPEVQLPLPVQLQQVYDIRAARNGAVATSTTVGAGVLGVEQDRPFPPAAARRPPDLRLPENSI
jgi:hypothetical protein